MNDATQILKQVQAGDKRAAEELLPLVYSELRQLAARKLACENPGQTFQATALVHEAYLRLVGHAPGKKWDHRGHFFAAAAEAMRRILVESARRRQALKRGGRAQRQDLEACDIAAPEGLDDLEIMAVHEALDDLAAKSPRRAELVKLRYFLGCTVAEAAQSLGISRAAAEEDWTYSRAWLRRHWVRAHRSQKNDEK